MTEGLSVEGNGITYTHTLVPISAEVMRGYAPTTDYLMTAMFGGMDRRANPWRYPDPNPMPYLRWWPWIDQAIAWRTEGPARIRGAIDVLRYGVPDPDEW